MYSEAIVTDDNFDKELEELCELMECDPNSYNSFIEKLDDNFSLQINNGKEEWICSKNVSNKGSDFKQAYQKGQVAYEFGNGFIVIDYEVVL